MGMSIDEAIATIKGDRWVCCQEKYIEAINLMENVMRKYEKIEQILKDIPIKVLEQEPSRNMEKIKEVINCDADAETKCKMISNILTAKGVSEMKKGYDGTCPVCGRNVFSGLKKCQCWHCDNVLIWENGHWKRKLMS